MKLNDRFGDADLVDVNQASYKIERLGKFAFVLGKHLTPDQWASALEEWGLVCQQMGWRAPKSL